MEVGRISVILSITCLVMVQGIPTTISSTDKHQQNDEVSRILQSPLYRNIAPSQDDYSSYFPIKYDIAESRETVDDATDATGVPSSKLQPPKINAPELFSESQDEDHELSKELPTHQFLPIPVKSIKFFEPNPASHIAKVPSTIPDNSYYPINPLSKQLDLPLPNAPQTFAPPQVPARELQLPIYQPFVPFKPVEKKSEYNQNFYKELSTHLELPYLSQPKPFQVSKDELVKPKKSITKVFPKKYNQNIDEPLYKKSGKKIPVIEVGEDYDVNKEVSFNKPEKLVFNPQQTDALDLDTYLEEKEIDIKRVKFEEAQKKQMQKKEAEEKQHELVEATRARAAVAKEPLASETEFNSFGSSFVAAPLHYGHHSTGSIGLGDVAHDVGGQRTEFQMHGQHGPHSYKFGYDTGKGKNRQFRYEERNNEGYVKGHYGFYDKHGKLQVINYDAHPHHGFHAEGSFGRV